MEIKSKNDYLLFNSGKRGSFESQRLSICSNLSSRRQSSARTMSQNVQQNLRALRQEQHRYVHHVWKFHTLIFCLFAQKVTDNGVLV